MKSQNLSINSTTSENIVKHYFNLNDTKSNLNTRNRNYFVEHPLYQNNTHVNWSLLDPIAEGYEVYPDGLGLKNVCGWFLNNMRISLYGEQNNTPIWEYVTLQHFYYNYVSISESGNIIAAGSYKNFYVFSRDSATPFFNFDVTNIVQAHRAHFVNLTSDGTFLIGVSMPQEGVTDSAVIYCFSLPSTVPVWQKKIFNNQQFDGLISGIRLSGNDSLFILSTIFKFFVIETYTGQTIFQGNIGPNTNSNTQEKQGINGDGSIISTTSHDGYLTVYKRFGNNYIQQWRYKDTNSSLMNQWITVSDITDDGRFLACGTLDWLWGGYFIYDGQIKFFDILQGPFPKWEYMHMGDMVTSVSFSKSGNILSACSWGDFADTAYDIVIFKSFLNTNIPIFRLSSPGSMFNCNTSENGTNVMVTGKKIHARVLGNGGWLYNITVDTNDNPIGIIGTGKVPDNFKLYQNYPNPFNSKSKIKFQIAKLSEAKLVVYDVLGREIQYLVNEELKPGTYETEFNGSNLPSGVYYYTLTVRHGGSSTDNFFETKKMVLIK